MDHKILRQTDEDVVILPGARVSGDVTMGHGCSVWYNAVIRGDEAPITVGENTNIQDNCTLHTSYGHPLQVGSGVTVGHNAILHSCTVEDNCLIGMGAIVLDDAVIGRDCIVGHRHPGWVHGTGFPGQGQAGPRRAGDRGNPPERIGLCQR